MQVLLYAANADDGVGEEHRVVLDIRPAQVKKPWREKVRFHVLNAT